MEKGSRLKPGKIKSEGHSPSLRKKVKAERTGTLSGSDTKAMRNVCATHNPTLVLCFVDSLTTLMQQGKKICVL